MGHELEGLLRGLEMARMKGYKSLIVEGDSLLDNIDPQKMIDGSNPEKLSKNWRLSYGWTQIVGIITSFPMIIPAQVKRSVNSVATIWPT
jgi:hypothetical protein